jgi:hypothetical protein
VEAVADQLASGNGGQMETCSIAEPAADIFNSLFNQPHDPSFEQEFVEPREFMVLLDSRLRSDQYPPV